MINNATYIFISLFVIYYSPWTYARLIIEGSNNFKDNVTTTLDEAKRSSPYLARLVKQAKNTSIVITIKPITDDRLTWHHSGKKSRSHTEARDNLKRGEARNTPTDAIIFLNPKRVSKTHKTFSSGVLLHELVHAVDLVKGHYNGKYQIRERRAIFFQNIWRDTHFKRLRRDYHGRFNTLDYQDAKKNAGLKRFVDSYFYHNGLQ